MNRNGRTRGHAWGGLVVAGLLLAACTAATPSADIEPLQGASSEAASRLEVEAAQSPAPPGRRTGTAHRPLPDAVTRAQEQWSRDYTAAMLAHLESQAASGDPYALLALAVMRPLPEEAGEEVPSAPGEVPEWMETRARAILDVARRLPDDPLVAWMETQMCPAEVSGCDPAAALARLQALEPDNAASWLPSLTDAWRQGDEAAIDRYLDLAAASERFDTHYGDYAALLTEAMREVPLPPLGADLREAMGRSLGLDRPVTDADLAMIPSAGLAAAYGLPSFNSLMKVCRPGGPTLPAPPRASACRAVMAKLSAGDTMIERAIGLGTLVRLSVDQPRGAYWREQLRRYYWISDQYPRMDAFAIPGFWEAHVYQGEMPALERYLQQQGRLEPPAGWLPTDPRRRALVLTGRDPPPG